MSTQLISYLQDTGFDLYIMREWLSGGAPPCQGGGRGFDPRLALEKRTIPNRYRSFFRALPGLESSMSTLRMENFRSKREYVFVPVCIGASFCMRMTAGPDFTWLCLIGGAAEEEAFQCGTVKGEEGPEVTEACEGWCGNHGE